MLRSSDNFNHSEFVSQNVKMPLWISLEKERVNDQVLIKVHPDLRINIHIDRDQVSVALDTLGNFCTNVGIEQRLILRQ
jgi:putative N6-adenine-specific DNA methylase